MMQVLSLTILTVLCLPLPTISTLNQNSYKTENNTNGPELTFEGANGKYNQGSEIKLSPSQHLYCNDYTSISGQEGDNKAGFTLRQLHIVITPGGTNTPLHTNEHHIQIPDQPCQILSKSEEHQKIKSFAETSTIYSTVQHDKHGFKHFHPIIGADCTSTHLTNTGFKQSISTGEHLFKKYFSNPAIKLKPHTASLHAESVVHQSSYQSLLAFLHGLLPEKVFAKTKVDKASDNLCYFEEHSSLSCLCPKANELYNYVHQSVVKGRFMFKDTYPDTHIAQSLLGDVWTKGLSPLELFHVLMFHICDNLATLCDTNRNCMNISSLEQVESLNYLVSSFFKTVSHDATFQLFSRLYTFPFLQRLVTAIDERGSTPPLHVHSTDSFFLHILLSSLGIRFQNPIPTASRLVFEVYEKKWGQPDEGTMFFSILYNGRDVTNNLAFCDGLLTEGLCSVEQLKEKVSSLKVTYQENC